MSTVTDNLGLFKYDTITDGEVPFSITEALNNNWDILDSSVNNYVKKSGDTMTGDLDVNTGHIRDTAPYASFQAKSNTITYNTAPSESTGIGQFVCLDKNDQWVCMFKAERYTDNHTVVTMQGHSHTGESGRLELISDTSGNWYSRAPHTSYPNAIVTQQSLSKSANGYLKFGNGIIIQWGSIALAANTAKTVSLPTSFSSTNYKVASGVDTTSQSGNEQNWIQIGSIKAGSFTLKKCDAGTLHWIAIGY